LQVKKATKQSPDMFENLKTLVPEQKKSALLAGFFHFVFF